jgi:uncharacterized protein (TIGR00251 family)
MPTVTLYIQPGAKHSRIVGRHDGMPKIAIKARPIDGEANAALIEFLADLAAVPKASVKLLSGQSSRIKRLEVDKAVIDSLDQNLPPS